MFLLCITKTYDALPMSTTLTTSVTFRLEDDLIAKADAEAKRQRLKRSHIMREALHQYFATKKGKRATAAK